MSTVPQPPSNPAARGYSGTTLILALALAVCATAAVVLAVLHFRQPASGGAAGETLEQNGKVSPQSASTGVVYYPIPYGAPPNLKVAAAKREYDIVKQDETGFTWKAIATIDDIRDDQRQNAQAMIGVGIRHVDAMTTKLKPGLVLEDFTWEAIGVRAGKDAVFVQQGTFNTVADKEGEVNFPIPYASAPNVELSGPPSGAVIVVESRPASFKWKNVPQTTPFAVNSGSVTWKTKGIRTSESPPAKSQ